MATVLDYLLDDPVVIVLLMVGSGMLLWRTRRGSIRTPAAALLIDSTALLIWKVAHANIPHHLARNVVLVLFVLVGTGMLLGHVKIKGVSLGAAVVLFCGIALTAWGAAATTPIEVPKELGTLGLAILTFAIGIQSRPNLFHAIRAAGRPLALLLSTLDVATLATVGVGRLLGFKAAMIARAFAGAVTNTPTLVAAGNAAAMAGDKAGPGDATVAHVVTYLYGIIGMLFFCLLALHYRYSDKNTPSPLINRTIRVEREDGPLLGNIVETISGQLCFSRLRRGEKGPITRPKSDDRLYKDDFITVVGTQDTVNQAIKAVGHGSSHSLIKGRKYLDFRRITVLGPKLAGRTAGELDIDSRFGATISRVRRGDVDMVSTPGLMLQQGDQVRVVGLTGRMKEISTYFGDSSRGLSSVNLVTLGLGMALGIFIGEWKFLMPTGAAFSIGSATGTLLIGLIFGRTGCIGKFVTAMPFTVMAMLSEFGLLVFLAQAGTKAGGEIAHAFTGGDWWRIFVIGFIVTTIVGLGIYTSMCRIVKMGGIRPSGLIGGAQTQSAIPAFANERTDADPQVVPGYAMVYPVAMIVKISITQVLGGL